MLEAEVQRLQIENLKKNVPLPTTWPKQPWEFPYTWETYTISTTLGADDEEKEA